METTPKPAEAAKPKSRTWMLIAIVVVILIVVGVAAFILTQQTTTATPNVLLKDDGTCTPGPPPDAACLFSPASYNATVNGAAVVWKNSGTAPHTVTANSTANGSLPTFGSSTLSGGNTYSFVFTLAGTYHYYCSIHPWMKAVIYAK